jgi:hypothetical protein
MPTLLPKDADNNVIPALRLKNPGAHTLAVTATSARNTTAFNAETRVVSVYATGAVYLKFGDGTVVAASSDHYFPAGVYYDIALSGGSDKGPHFTHVAALRVDVDCTVYISEKE